MKEEEAEFQEQATQDEEHKEVEHMDGDHDDEGDENGDEDDDGNDGEEPPKVMKRPAARKAADSGSELRPTLGPTSTWSQSFMLKLTYFVWHSTLLMKNVYVRSHILLCP